MAAVTKRYMNEKEVRQLITEFKGYRDLIAPIQKNLNEFLDTYESMQGNINSLNAAFSGDLKGKLDDIFKQMASQVSKANDLASRVEQFSASANKYAGEVANLSAQFSKVEERLGAIKDLDKKVENQINRLDGALEEKTRVYDIKALEKALNTYGQDIKQVSQFLNKDVASTLLDSKSSVDSIKAGLDEIVKSQRDEKTTLTKLLEQYAVSNDFLKKITESQDVNEAVLFEIFDRWAASRRVKTKK